MTYAETIAYLYDHLPMFTRIGVAAYKKDLHNTIALLEALGNPHKDFKTIHVAGTNGKGSTSHMLAAIFQQCGYKTGLYTSPHLVDFGERIRINGKMIDEQFVVDFVEQTKSSVKEIEPSFFELTVAMAFQYFKQEKVDIAIIETGLGGRLDSTNVIMPLCSVITNIGWDHMNILGDTLPKIAAEKAGIIKPNVPVVIGETLPETKEVFLAKAAQENAELFFAEKIFDKVSSHVHLASLGVDIDGEKFTLDLPGLYQVKNLRTVLTTVAELRKLGYELPLNKVKEAVRQVKKLTGLQGRWDLLQTDPNVIADVAHNVDGMQQILAQLETLKNNGLLEGHLHIVLGMVSDKDVTKVLSILPKNATYYFCHANIPRAMPAEELKDKANPFDLAGKNYETVKAALAAAKQEAQENDLILICGSVFVVGEVYG